MDTKSYDITSPESLLEFACLLKGKSLRQLHPEAVLYSEGKGGFGQTVEKYHFGYEPNDKNEPDFVEAGVELKCTPLKQIKDGSMVSKERLVLNIINYIEEYDKDFKTSSFMHKNALILLMFYLHLKGVDKLDLLFKIIRLWSIPEEDLKIFVDDWNVIHEKIIKGRAHEISEGDTLYLSACRKGAGHDQDGRKQPSSDVLADQRAYSIKSAYLNHIIVDSLSHPEMCDGVKMTAKQRRAIEKKKAEIGSVVRSFRDYQSGETFEQLVIRRFKPFLGMSTSEIAAKCKVKIQQNDKSLSYTICRAILGVKAAKIAEFEKADIQLKTVRLEPLGFRLKEHMSFRQIKYTEIVNEENWEDSYWYNTIAARRFFFVVFRKKRNGTALDAVMENAFFWSMPIKDIEASEVVWKDTRDKVRAGDYKHFMGITKHPICHIRPKGKNAADMMSTPQGGCAKKYCYWLHKDYVLNILKTHQ